VRTVGAKRTFDVAASAVALLILAPVILAVAVVIPLVSPGPALYRARRVGRNGELFTMFKFRTMHEGSGGSSVTTEDDPRVFPLGRWLRRLKIDELPQLLNVLKGDMSVVGPRPEDPEVVARHYTPAQRETLSVRPGLTSPGSIYYYLSGEDTLSGEEAERDYLERIMPKKLAFDLRYVEEASLANDLRVIWRTVRVIVMKALGLAEPAGTDETSMFTSEEWVLAPRADARDERQHHR